MSKVQRKTWGSAQIMHNMLFPSQSPKPVQEMIKAYSTTNMSLEKKIAMHFIDAQQPTKMSKVVTTSAKNSQAIPAPTTSMGCGTGMRGRGIGR